MIEHPGPNPRSAVSSYYELGAPIVLVCNGELQRWRQTTDAEAPVLVERVESRNVSNYFDQNRDQLSSREVFRRKTVGRLNPASPKPNDFVDAGLLPAVEEEVGDRLAARVQRAIAELSQVFDQPLSRLQRPQRQWILESTFYLLAAKLLKDKAAEGSLDRFHALDLGQVDEVFREVAGHYGSEHPPLIETDRQRDALLSVAAQFRQFRYLGNITASTLGDVYEGGHAAQSGSVPC